MKKTILILAVLFSSFSVSFAHIVKNESFRCETKSFSDFEDGVETRQFKQLWAFFNNDFSNISSLMKYLQVEDFYNLEYLHTNKSDSLNWIQNFSVQRPIIGEYSYIFKRISSKKARNYYDFEFLLKGDSVFAIRLDNNCKSFTLYDKQVYCELAGEYSKTYKIETLKYCRDFSFFTNYCFGPLYDMPGQQINPLFNEMIKSVYKKDFKQLDKCN
ncbi:MAG: hypothetical protein ACXWDO_02290 [Bacteroidia bacterium]